MKRAYKIFCTLADGQRVPVASFDDLSQAKATMASLSRYWPHDYAIVSADEKVESVKEHAPKELIH